MCVNFHYLFLYFFLCVHILSPFLLIINHIISLFNAPAPWNWPRLVLERLTTCLRRSARINPTTIKREWLALGLKVSEKSAGLSLRVLWWCHFLHVWNERPSDCPCHFGVPEALELTQKEADSLYLKIPGRDRVVLKTAGPVTSVFVSGVQTVAGEQTSLHPHNPSGRCNNQIDVEMD